MPRGSRSARALQRVTASRWPQTSAMPSFSGLLIISARRLRRAVPARPLPAHTAAGGRARDRGRDRRRAERARVGRGRSDDRRRLDARARVPAVPRRSGDRLRPPARAGADAHRARVRACRSRSPLVVGLGLQAAGLVDAPLLVAITLVATSLGVLIPVLKDAGESASTLGQLVIAAGLDRGLRRDHPALDLLHRRGRDRRHAAADRLAARARRGRVRSRSAARSARCGSAPTCCACRTPPRRSASAARWCCSSASRRSRSRSGWRRSSAPSRPARS